MKKHCMFSSQVEFSVFAENKKISEQEQLVIHSEISDKIIVIFFYFFPKTQFYNIDFTENALGNM